MILTVEDDKVNVDDEKVIKENQMVYTRKELKRMLLPSVGDIIEGDKVTYINLGKLRYTASYTNEPPIIGVDINVDDKVYTVGHIDMEQKRYTATLSNVIQKEPEAPDVDIPNDDENIAKLI